jgi:hypothetical protein
MEINDDVHYETEEKEDDSSVGQLNDKQVRFVELEQKNSQVWKNILMDCGDQLNLGEPWSSGN